jgi:hypothetical protein
MADWIKSGYGDMKPAALFLFAAALLVSSCSSGPAPQTAQKKAPEKPEPVGALKAFYRAYQQARTWSPDIEVLRVESVNMNTLPAAEGKYPAWRTTFVSTSKRGAKTYSYSVIEAEGLYKDVFAGHEEAYAGPRGQTSPFSHQAFKIDSDAAYQTALKKSEDFVKKHPDLPVFMVLEKVKEFGNPAWRVYWGTSIATSSYSVYVDASTGDYLKTMR